jgi:hypothetical protein
LFHFPFSLIQNGSQLDGKSQGQLALLKSTHRAGCAALFFPLVISYRQHASLHSNAYERLLALSGCK